MKTDELVLEEENEEETDSLWEWFTIVITVFSVLAVALSFETILMMVRIISMINSFAE